MIISPKAFSGVVLFLTFTSVLSATPRLGLSSSTIGPINIATGSNGPNQSVQAYNLGDGSLSLTATSSQTWLSATVGSQTACAQAAGGCYPISIALNTSSLAAGTYTEYLTLTSSGAIDSPQTISVTVNTAGVPGSITAYVTPTGSFSSELTFPVFTQGTGVKGTVTVQSGGNWLQFLNGSSGLIVSSSPWLIQVAAQTGQVAGTYTGTIVITGSSVASDNKTINVTLVVTNAPIISSAANTPVLLAGYQGGPAQYAVVGLNNLSTATALSVSGGSSSAAFLSVSNTGSSLLITATPGSLTPGIYSGTVTVTSNAANNSQIAIPVEFTIAPAGQPLIFTGGIVNAATGAQEAVAQGDVAAIYGSQFAATGTFAVNAATPLAATLAGTQVLVNGVPAPLYFVSPGQINFQIPYGVTPGALTTVQVVSNSTLGNIRSLGVAAVVPRLLPGFISGYGAIVNGSDNSLTFPTGTAVPGFTTHPAKPGDTIVIYAIGFGQTTPAAVEGQAAPATAPLESLSVNNVTVIFGGGFSGSSVSAKPSFVGLTPTDVGLYQVNVVIPSTISLGAQSAVTLVVNGVQSNYVYLATSATGK